MLEDKTETKPNILAIIPCFNEEKSLPNLLNEFQSLPQITPLVIDDGSKDQTFQVAKGFGKALKLPINLGIGGAVQTGILYAAKNNYDFCVQVDGDGQHRPDQISLLLEKQRESGANLVVGSRFLHHSDFQSTRLRRIGISVLQYVFKIFYHAKITDPTSGFRLMDRKAILFFQKNYPHDFPEPISIAKAIENDFTVCEVAVKMRSREHGTSSIYGLKNISYMVRVTGYLLLFKLGRILK